MCADKPSPSTRSAIDPFVVMDVMAAANQMEAGGRSIMHLEVGQPGAPVPEAVRSLASDALSAGPLAYTDALGLPSLRARIAQYYAEHHNVTVDPERVVVTAGSSAAFILTFLACFEAGDKVGVPEPGYPAYRNTLLALGCEPVTIPAGPENNWALTPESIDRADQRSGPLKGVLVASPSNPTGAMLTRPQISALADSCAATGRWFLSDEIYHRIAYDHQDISALETGDDAIVINSFSKYYCMTGWRLGWAVVPERLVRPIERLAQNLFISPPTLSQLAAEKAFDEAMHLDANVAVYAENRQLLLEELPKAGITDFAPADGAFYLYADVSHLTDNSATFCEKMLQEAGVAATPGVDFDPTHGHRYVRFSFAGKTSDMVEAARRLQRWLGA